MTTAVVSQLESLFLLALAACITRRRMGAYDIISAVFTLAAACFASLARHHRHLVAPLPSKLGVAYLCAGAFFAALARA
jgi:drug/metabolite transporter (DMT)-like permease